MLQFPGDLPVAITTVDVQELSTRFAEVFSLASSGSEVLITENHIPVARLVPLTPGQARIPGLHAGASSTSNDFDAPLPDGFWLGTP